MSFLTLINRNMVRNKMRSLLTIVGIEIWISPIVVLGALSNGITVNFDKTIHSGDSDFSTLIKQQNYAGNDLFGTSTLSKDWLNKIKEVTGVKNAKGICLVTLPVENKFLSVGGVSYDSLDLKGNMN